MAETVNPGALAGVAGARDRLAGAGKPEHIARRRAAASRFRIEYGGEVLSVSLNGRVLQTLLKLIAAGRRGITAWDFPHGARVAHYVFRLRQTGILIDTEMEPHGGETEGMHARYRLAPGVRIKAEVA